jgi:hypothetical protein
MPIPSEKSRKYCEEHGHDYSTTVTEGPYGRKKTIILCRRCGNSWTEG